MTRELTLDPADWDAFRREAHGALDTMIDYLRDIREQPVWRPIPPAVLDALSGPAPEAGIGLERALNDFRRDVLPYPTGNVHPRFWSWVCGTGSPVGMVADMLASGMNPLTLGFDDSAATRVELQVVDWFRALFGFPPGSTGLLVSGGSMANLVGLAVGRTAKADYDVRARGVGAEGTRRQVVYNSSETHTSIQKAAELLGFGAAFVRTIPVNENFEVDPGALEEAIRADAAAGLRPSILVANAGTVNTGAIDPMNRLADVAAAHDLWLHVDGAFGAIAALTHDPPSNLRGLDRADSLAFDLHKWLHQPYSVGAVLVRHAAPHIGTFRLVPAYLDTPGGGVAAGPSNFNALGVQLSRSFVALRPWLTFKTHGVKLYRDLTTQNIRQARYLDGLVRDTPGLELLAPTALNIVNYRFNPGGLSDGQLDALNGRLLVRLQEDGVAAPSSTRIDGRFAIRVCITNHRTRTEDLDLLVEASLRSGHEIAATGAGAVTAGADGAGSTRNR